MDASDPRTYSPRVCFNHSFILSQKEAKNKNNAIKTAHITDANVTMPKIVNPYKARVHINAASQSIADNTATLITFDTEDYDTNGNFNNAAANYKYVAPVTGFYLVLCHTQISDATGKVVSVTTTMFKDAVAIGSQAQIPYPGSSTAGAFAMTLAQVVNLTAGEAISFKATIDTSDGGAGEVLGGVNGSYCSFHLLSI